MFAASLGESRPVPSALTSRSNYKQEERCGKLIAAATRTRRETAADTSAARTAYAFTPHCNARHRFEDCPPNCMRLQSFAPFSPWRFKPRHQPIGPGYRLRRHLPCTGRPVRWAGNGFLPCPLLQPDGRRPLRKRGWLFGRALSLLPRYSDGASKSGEAATLPGTVSTSAW